MQEKDLLTTMSSENIVGSASVFMDTYYFQSIALFLWANLHQTLVVLLLVLASPMFCFYWFRLPNTSERRVRHFIDAFIVNPYLCHRGGYPENTLSGICLSKKRGLKVVEVDVEYTKDGVPVLLHDRTVDRTSKGTGHIRDLTLAQVRDLDFGCKFGSQYVGEKIPTLQEAIDLCLELDLLLFIDVKSNPMKTARLLKRLFREKDLYDRVVVVSFYPELLYLVRRADPNIVVGLAMRDWEFTWELDGSCRHDRRWRQMLAPLYDIVITWFNHNIVWRLMELPFVELYKGDITEKRVEFWRKRGALVIAWTMEQDEAENFHKNLKLPIMVDIQP